jgi:hypothetical protein
MNAQRTDSSRLLRGFTLMELQVAIVLLTFGIATLASLLTTQSRLIKRLQGDFKPGATVYLTPTKDPWVKKLNTPARITAATLTQSAPAGVTAVNTVSIISQQQDLSAQSITVAADVIEIP